MRTERKILIGASVAAAALLGADTLFLHVIQKKVKETDTLVANEITAGEKQKRAETLRRIMEETKTEREELDAYFVKKGDAVSFIERLENMAKGAGLGISIASVSVPEKTSALRIEMATQGSFENTLYFLTLLENLPYKIFVEKANLHHKEGSSQDVPKGSGTWTGSFTVVLESFINS